MLRWIQGFSLTEHQTNLSIRKKAGVLDLSSHLMKRRLHWYSHVRRRCSNDATSIALNQTVTVVQRRDRPKLRSMDVVKQDMKNNGVEEAPTPDRRLWAASVATATHLGGQAGRRLTSVDKPGGDSPRWTSRETTHLGGQAGRRLTSVDKPGGDSPRWTSREVRKVRFMLTKLKHYGLEFSSLKLLQSYLTNREQSSTI